MEIKPIPKENIDNIILEIIKVYQESYKKLHTYAYIDENKILEYIKWLIKRDPKGNLILEENGQIIGYMAIDTNWYSKIERDRVGEVHEIFIKPEYQRQGLGRKMFIEAENIFKSKKINLIEAWVGETNLSAVLFYEACGFESKNKRWNKWIRMTKKI